VDEAIVFTSYHQSPLPAALLLRLAGVGRIAAISADYPGSLLDVRHTVADDLAEPLRALSLAAAAGYPPPPGDDGRLRVDLAHTDGGYVVVHPGSNADARSLPPRLCAEIYGALRGAGYQVVVTGSADEAQLAATAGPGVRDLTGQTDLPALAGVLAGASCLVAGNTGPAHLAAAAGTPIVSLFAPTVPFGQWGPYRVPVVRLGDAAAPCSGTRTARCPLPQHPCLSSIDPDDVVAGVTRLTRSRP
jgi:ADP-heptose:LPS heptosyltransferase